MIGSETTSVPRGLEILDLLAVVRLPAVAPQVARDSPARGFTVQVSSALSAARRQVAWRPRRISFVPPTRPAF